MNDLIFNVSYAFTYSTKFKPEGPRLILTDSAMIRYAEGQDITCASGQRLVKAADSDTAVEFFKKYAEIVIRLANPGLSDFKFLRIKPQELEIISQQHLTKLENQFYPEYYI